MKVAESTTCVKCYNTALPPTYLPLNEYIHLIFAKAENSKAILSFARIRPTCDIVSNESSFFGDVPYTGPDNLKVRYT
jgi:hypothetical protein